MKATLTHSFIELVAYGQIGYVFLFISWVGPGTEVGHFGGFSPPQFGVSSLQSLYSILFAVSQYLSFSFSRHVSNTKLAGRKIAFCVPLSSSLVLVHLFG